jgi:hypothetical protein
MLLLWFVCMLQGFAADWGKPKPYVQPVLTGGVISVNGQTHALATGGAVAGVTVRDRDDPHWLSHTRTQLTGTYGLTSGSLGADARVGSFIGPDTKLIRYQVGPDLYYNGYGNQGAPDYFLAWSPGLDLRNTALVKLSKPVKLYGELTPGWVFAPSRQASIVAPFHELRMLASLIVSTKVLRITVGVQRHYSAAGVIDSLVLSGAL